MHPRGCSVIVTARYVYSCDYGDTYVHEVYRVPSHDGFPALPLDDYCLWCRHYGGRKAVCDLLEFHGIPYTVCEVFSYPAAPRELTLCVQHGGDFFDYDAGWSVYTLSMPERRPPDAMDLPAWATPHLPGWAYPQPEDWHHALSRRYTHEESHFDHEHRYDDLPDSL